MDFLDDMRVSKLWAKVFFKVNSHSEGLQSCLVMFGDAANIYESLIDSFSVF